MEIQKQGFSLLELLIVVLIIGILAAIAFPNYQRVKETTIMAEGIQIVRQIFDAHQAHYIIRNSYTDDIDDLDIRFDGIRFKDNGTQRVQTDKFLISTAGAGSREIALVHRLPYGSAYYMYIYRTPPYKLKCSYYSGATQIQKQLCTKLNVAGHL